MTIADLHPEDLLDRDARGVLSESERALLSLHLASCAACRLERQVRADFAEELGAQNPAHDGSLLVLRALETAKREPEGAAPARARTAGRRVRATFLVAAAVMLAGAAGAARLTGAWPTSSREPATVPITAPSIAPTAKAIPARAALAAVPQKADSEELALPLPVAATSAAPEAAVAARAQAPEATARPRAASAPHVRAPEPALATSPAPAPTPVPGPSEAFERANAARRSGDHARAVGLYRDLLRDHPTAPEASAARVALARVLLDDGEPEGALRAFEAYLAGGDAVLREEAMAGRARALGRLGRDKEERGAWWTLLDSYPQSIHADRARARIEELGHR